MCFLIYLNNKLIPSTFFANVVDAVTAGFVVAFLSPAPLDVICMVLTSTILFTGSFIILDEIEKSKQNSLEKLLFGLGIRHFGEKSALVLAKNFASMERLKTVTFEELVSIPDIGDVMARSILEYFSDSKNLALLDVLKSYGINMEYLGRKIVLDDHFAGKKFVITGMITFMARDKIKDEITSRGGICVDSVSKKTSVVVVGENPGSKYEKAKNLGIEIWNEEKLKEMLGDGK